MHSETTIGGVCRLTDRGLIRARGPDAATFLQGQLTNDVSTLSEGAARLAGFCSAKGRLQASFVIWKAASDDYLLTCPVDIFAPTLKRLSMFVLRAKCKLGDAMDELELYGVAGASAHEVLAGLSAWQTRMHGTAHVVALPDAAGLRRGLVAVPAASRPEIVDAPAMSLDTWRWLEVQSGIVTIEAAIVDRFVPQMVNFELVGGVDFQKGCYPGQEVVARSQYRGTTRRRTFLFDCETTPVSGQDVFVAGDTGEAAGTVANAAPRPDGIGGSALVEVRLAALAGDDLRLASPSGPRLIRAELGYRVPLEAEPAT
jgi:folate-binding protein YgfZ